MFRELRPSHAATAFATARWSEKVSLDIRSAAASDSFLLFTET